MARNISFSVTLNCDQLDCARLNVDMNVNQSILSAYDVFVDEFIFELQNLMSADLLMTSFQLTLSLLSPNLQDLITDNPAYLRLGVNTRSMQWQRIMHSFLTLKLKTKPSLTINNVLSKLRFN